MKSLHVLFFLRQAINAFGEENLGHIQVVWFIKGHVTHCNLTLLSFGKAGSPGIDHVDKETSTRPPSFSKPVRLGFPDFTPPSDRRDRSWFLATATQVSFIWHKFWVFMSKDVRYQIVHFIEMNANANGHLLLGIIDLIDCSWGQSVAEFSPIVSGWSTAPYWRIACLYTKRLTFWERKCTSMCC